MQGNSSKESGVEVMGGSKHIDASCCVANHLKAVQTKPRLNEQFPYRLSFQPTLRGLDKSTTQPNLHQTHAQAKELNRLWLGAHSNGDATLSPTGQDQIPPAATVSLSLPRGVEAPATNSLESLVDIARLVA